MKNNIFLHILLSIGLCMGPLSASAPEPDTAAAASSPVDGDYACAICWDEEDPSIQITALPCGHSFHTTCIAKTFIQRLENNGHPQCPYDCPAITQIPTDLIPLIDVRGLLNRAAKCGHTRVVTFLCDNGAHVNQRYSKRKHHTGKTPLHRAIMHGKLEMVNTLLAHGARANDTTGHFQYAKSMLQIAVEYENLEIVRALLIHAQENRARYYGLASFTSSQSCRVVYGEEQSSGCSLGGGSYTPIERTDYGDTALHTATRIGRLDMAAMLIRCGADIYAKGLDDYTPIELAAHLEHLEMLDLLADQERDGLLARKEHFLKALEQAATEGHTDVVMHLLAKFPRYTERALQIAAEMGHHRLVHAILRNDGRFSINTRIITFSQKTILHVAAERGHLDVVNYLLSQGANPKLLTITRKTALDLARENGHAAVADIIAEAIENGIPMQMLG